MWRWICLTTLLLGTIYTGNAKQTCTPAFQLVADLVLVDASVDGQEGYFILDTGAPSLVLNAAHFEGTASDLEAVGLHQAVAIQEKTVKRFTWACLQKRNFKSLVLDLTHLETRIQKPLLGLIGYELLKDWHILFDYSAQEIGLYGSKLEEMDGQAPLASVAFRLVEHLVVVELAMHGQPYRFIIDSASGANLLDSSIQTPNLLPLEEAIIVRTADQSERRYTQTIVQQASMSSADFFNQVFVQVELSQLVGAPDGLLGFPFLSCCKISIDYKRKRVLLWEQAQSSEALSLAK